jgi:hypothetical protein
MKKREMELLVGQGHSGAMKPLSSLRRFAFATGSVVTLLLALTLPPMADLACLGFAVVLGAMGAVWTWLTDSGPADVPAGSRPLEAGLRVALLGGAAAVSLAGFALLFGPASVIVLPALYGVAAVAFWLLRAPWPSAS